MYQNQITEEVKKISSPLIKHLLHSMKQGERSEFTIVKDYINSNDEDNFEDNTLNDLLGNNYDNQKDLFVEINLQ